MENFVKKRDIVKSKLKYGDKTTIAKTAKVDIEVVNNMLKCNSIESMSAVQQDCWVKLVDLIMGREEKLKKSLERIDTSEK